MTENVYKAKTVSDNEVIELLEKHIEANIAMMDLSPKGSEISEFEKRLDAYSTMIDVMKEIQQYRAIGTAEEIEPYVRLGEKLNLCDLVRENARLTKKVRFLEICEKALREYKEIGTVEECREARERQREKKIIVSHNGAVEDRGKAFCPNCRMDIHGVGMIGACFRCGQRLKWSDAP